MTLQDIYDQLSFGELRMLFMGQNPTGSDTGLPADSFVKMLPHIQLALTALYTRFPLREERVTVPLVLNQVTYVLSPGKALERTWDQEILEIQRVYGIFEGEEYEIPLNEVDNPYSIRTTSYNTLLVPTKPTNSTACWIDETTELVVVYRANHQTIDKAVAETAPIATPINLPAAYLEPLLFHVASRLHNPIGMSQEFHEGNNYAMKYEMSCQRLEQAGFFIDSDYDDGERFKNAGWA